MMKVSCALTQHFSKFRAVCGLEWKKKTRTLQLQQLAAAGMSEDGIGRGSFVVYFVGLGFYLT